MDAEIDAEFRAICTELANEGLSHDEWAQRESDDMFQTESYVGGFDATEGAFCFSKYDQENEFWFQLTLEEVKAVATGQLTTVSLRPARS